MILLTSLAFLTPSTPAQNPGAPPAPIRITVDARKAGVEVPRSLFGVFFEEINHAGEGGVHAEKLQNQTLIGDPDSKTGLPTGWSAVGAMMMGQTPSSASRVPATSGTVTFERSASDGPFDRSIKIVKRSQEDLGQLVNDGFWGISARKGEKHALTFWAKSDIPFWARLAPTTTLEGRFPATALVRFPSTGGQWRRVTKTIVAPETDAKTSLVVSVEGTGTLRIGYASLKPERTWKGHGLRPDLAERVAAMRPGFFRFPGGCYIEGNSLANAWDWKATLGAPEKRPGSPRTFWGYPSGDGLGFHEYLQFCEDLGAKAMYVANCGLSHSDMASLEGTGVRSMARYVQDALDAIEYANGPVTSKWGAMRAKAGHPKPFGLKYLEIGNENGYSWSFGGPAAYAPRFRMVQAAIRAKYPEIVTIANTPIQGGPQDYDLLSEHYYESPSWFWRNANRYDAYDRKGPKIYVGEYAVTKGSGRGNLDGALGEAAFMTGMERNADVVRMASYAPLFENVADRQWNPNAIVFDNHRSYGTPSYWVQTLFAQNRIARVYESKTITPPNVAPTISGQVGLMTWNTQAEFKEIRLEPQSSNDIPPPPVPAPTGTWTAKDGLISQTGSGENRQYFLKGSDLHSAPKVVLSLKARKLGGDEGFMLLLGGTNDADRLAWNIGGWNNTRHAFQLGGAILEPAIENLSADQKIQTGRWYDLRLEREGDRVRGYIDGKLVQEATIPQPADLATIAGRAENGDLLVRIVNGSAASRETEIDLAGFAPKSGTVSVLTGALDGENSFETPEGIAPQTSRLPRVGARFVYRMPPHSLSILRLKR